MDSMYDRYIKYDQVTYLMSWKDTVMVSWQSVPGDSLTSQSIWMLAPSQILGLRRLRDEGQIWHLITVSSAALKVSLEDTT